jgi:FAD/FMN-containing dehydrogenases
MAVQWEKDLAEAVGVDRMHLDAETRGRLSRDYYWYSPVLEEELDGKVAECVVIPREEREVATVLSLACRHRVPVTVRGAGTGNYGQSVPLSGGIVLDLSGLSEIVDIGEGTVTVQCGVRLKALEKYLRERGQELRIYPSTFAKATVGGFVSGGSGGIGSITWGNLWDGNVQGLVVYTMEETPQRLTVTGDDLNHYIHSYGTTGVVVQVTLRTAPRTEWMQSIVQFADFETALRFSEALARDDDIRKRLVCVCEWPIPSWFIPILKYYDQGASVVLLETEEKSGPALSRLTKQFGGTVTHVIPATRYHKTIGLSDFTWNHTTLWALKSDPTVTYLQAAFSPGRYLDQLRSLKAQFGDEVLFHFEWIKNAGVVVPSALPIVRYTGKRRLYEIIDRFRAEGVRIFDPHTFVLDGGGRAHIRGMLEQKRKNDPFGLLNPGKLHLVTP